VIEDRLMRRITVPKGNEVRGERRIFNYEELDNLQLSTNYWDDEIKEHS
jgi:hypothetical protein